MQSTICLYSSQLASYIGLNPYKPAYKSFEELLIRYNLGKDKEKEQVEEMIEKVGKERVEEILKDATDIVKVDANIEVIKKLIEAGTLQTEDKKKIGEYLTREIRMEYGKNNENKVIQHYAQLFGMEVEADDKFYCEPVGDVLGVKWSVGGRIDGKTKDMILEIKNRTKRLFGRVPGYEKVQVMAYLYLFRNLGREKLRHVECFDCGEMKMNVTDFEWDQEYWNFLVKKLERFMEFFVKYQRDEEIRNLYEKLSEKQKEDVFVFLQTTEKTIPEILAFVQLDFFERLEQ